MLSSRKLIIRVMGLALALLIGALVAPAQQTATGTLRGQISDQFGGVIVGATVTATDASGNTRTATTSQQGVYVLTALPPGRYTLRAVAPGFAGYENGQVEVATGTNPKPLDITLSVALENQEVTVSSEAPLSTDPENNAGAIVLRGEDLASLPDDPDDLQSALQALAGPSAGPNGGQIYIDGFSDGRFPPKDSIREIRINSNPFSAEFDRLGYGRIEIFTKPGSDQYHGQASFAFNNQSLNSRALFAPYRAPFRESRYGGNLSGPIIARKMSFFFDFERRETNGNDIIDATVLDPVTLGVTPFSQILLAPRRRTTGSPRLDWQLNKNNTLVARYTYTHTSSQNAGVGTLSLPSRAYETTSTEQSVQLTETAVLNTKTINETRFQYVRRRGNTEGNDIIPTLSVLDAFTGGGPGVGLAYNNDDFYELQNYTSFVLGTHSLKAGGRLRDDRVSNLSPSNFAGTFTFAGGLAPQLVFDASGQVELDANGNPVFGLGGLQRITSIERYQRTLLLQRQGLTPAQIALAGGGASQFSIAGGNPLASVSQFDFGGFVQDDWKWRPNLTISLGLRYETQTNISSKYDFAPRLAFAYAPGAGSARNPKTVIRGGFGIFYDRVSDNLTLQANRFNGVNELQYTLLNPALLVPDITNLTTFTSVPPISSLTGATTSQIVYRLASNLQAPYIMQTAITLERQLPFKITLSTTYVNSHGVHELRSRNINAPLPGTYNPLVMNSGIRPFGNVGNIFEYESSGIYNQNQLIVSANNRLSRRSTFYVTYVLNKAMSNTDGSGTFPVNQYDLTGEYGRSALDVRHRFFLGGTIKAPWGVSVNPFIIASSGVPFNITTGRDILGTTLFNQRPAFAGPNANCGDPNIVCTSFGNFNLNPGPGDQIIPRNYGTGPSFFAVNLRLSKTFGFGGSGSAAAPRGGRGGGGGGRMGGGPFGGRGGGFGDAATEKRYNLTFSILARNIFNHANLAAPVGNLSSPLFGQSIAGTGNFGPFGGAGNADEANRRIEGQVRFTF